VNRLEKLLRLVEPRLSLHYWDWTTDPRVATADRVAILTGTAAGSPQGFMGSSSGNAGPPFADFESTEITGDPTQVPPIPGDGVHDHIWRGVAAGASPVAADSSILGNLDFTSFNTALQNAHNNAHGYIGGTIGGGPFASHFSFHDPMVFLLHSNMDRLWAMWQRMPGQQSRLNPPTAFGTILADEHLPSTYFDEWIQPWAGIVGGVAGDPQNGMPGTDLNPWKSDATQQAHIPYNDPSIIIPPSYDTAPHSSYIISNRDTFSNSEVAAISGVLTSPYGPATFANAFSVVYDGFEPKELGLTSTPLPAVPPNLPAFTFTGAGKITAVKPSASYEDPSGAIDMPQRIMISYDIHFADGSDFPMASGGQLPVSIQAKLNYNVDTGTGGTMVNLSEVTNTGLLLVNQPNPYMIDTQPGDPSPYWLSVDTRIFQRRTSDPALTGVTQGDMDANHNAPFEFIQAVVSAFNSFNPANPHDPSHPFLTQLSEDETVSQLELSQKVGGQRVYNYAVAKVRYLAPSGVDATNVSVFFRVFSTAVSALDYDAAGGTTGNYRRTGNTNAASVPLLGIENDSQGQPETASIPFFASARVDTSTVQMSTQPPDATNIQTIMSCRGAGAVPPAPSCPLNSENVAYFGAWLDINLAPGDPNFHKFPLSPSGVSGWPDGPYSGALQSIQQLMLGTHHCMVAEIFFWPPATGSDPIPHNASPASSDRLAQRNLVLVRTGNPGYPATHTVQHTFIVKPSAPILDVPGTVATQATVVQAVAGKQAKRGKGALPGQTAAAIVTTRHRGPDELIIRWNNVPRAAEATFYMPEITADEILTLSALRQHPRVLEKVDTHTLRCRLSDVTFIPLPTRKGTIAGLMSLVLPQGIRAGQIFKFSVEQYSGNTLKTLGAFQMTIPVRPDPEILPEEIRKLSVMRYIQEGIPASSRWYSIFVRYLDQIAARVRGFGGDPNSVKPSPDGSEGAAPVCPPHHPKEVCPPDLFCLNIPWEECDIEGELDIKLRFKRKCK
jgi:Common central domain of tyrosinase